MKIFIYNNEDLKLPDHVVGQIVKKPCLLSQYINNIQSSNKNTLKVSLTDDAKAADYILIPYNLEWFFIEYRYFNFINFLYNLPYFNQFEEKHVFFLEHDCSIPFHINSLYLRTNIDLFNKDPNVHPLPFIVEDLLSASHFELDKCKYDISFVGYIGSAAVRFRLLKNIIETNYSFRSYIQFNNQFHGHLNDETRKKTRTHMIESIRDSIAVLCPAGTGKVTIRFFEVMSMGRIPILISENCPLPFEEDIDYDSFILRIDENKVEKADEIISSWLSSQTLDQLQEKCMQNRRIWEHYFSKCFSALRIVELLLNNKNRVKITIPRITEKAQISSLIEQYYLRELEKENYVSSLGYLTMLQDFIDREKIQGYLELISKIKKTASQHFFEKVAEIQMLQSLK